jgi:hypothetical protein
MNLTYIFIVGALAGIGLLAASYAAYQGYRILQYKRRNPRV